LEEAVPAIYRGRQVIVVGDEMQLPPTSFFAAKVTDEE
jgi:superfamily I DNA and/or RNA helicase